MELQRRFSAGDVEAFEALFRQFQGQVYRWILRIVRDRAISEDLTVETFWRIHRARGRFDPNGNFGAWARRIATNVAIDSLRQRRPETELREDVAQGESPDPVIQTEERQAIQRAFRQLPVKLQAAATLALIEERPYEEIAEALGTSTGAVKLRVFRAVRILRKKLQHLGVQP